jgi:hypothetical protein
MFPLFWCFHCCDVLAFVMFVMKIVPFQKMKHTYVEEIKITHKCLLCKLIVEDVCFSFPMWVMKIMPFQKVKHIYGEVKITHKCLLCKLIVEDVCFTRGQKFVYPCYFLYCYQWSVLEKFWKFAKVDVVQMDKRMQIGVQHGENTIWNFGHYSCSSHLVKLPFTRLSASSFKVYYALSTQKLITLNLDEYGLL